jgi:Domain of unknown function (DUF1833)
MVISAALAKIYASAPVDEDWYETVELYHPAFTQRHYLTNAEYGFTARLENGLQVDFIQAPFEIKLPQSLAAGQGPLQLIIGNVDQQILLEIEKAATQPGELIEFVWRAYTSRDLNSPASDPIRLNIRQIEADAAQVSAQATSSDTLNRRFPSIAYDIRRFPGLDR